jgi:outer membrane protein OmpA-like peptidoglycan-associated protein
LFYSELFQLSNTVADSIYKKDILLQPIQLNATLTFSNIQFTTNSFTLPESGKIELNKLITLLNENPGIRVEIGGHTDNIGLPENNRVLSENRAKAIVQYLQENKIAANRLTWKGYGASQPIANNSSESGRALNRRTTFTIIGL